MTRLASASRLRGRPKSPRRIGPVWGLPSHWDCVVLDEYHYGAWRENAKELFEAEDKKEIEFGEGEGIEDFDEDIMPITTDAYLYLSGTPFRAIASGEFIEEQIYNWTYSDEQKAKRDWNGPNNPYAALPRMVLLTYQLPDAIREIAMQGEFNEFDLNVFFSAEGIGDKAKFKYEDEVQKWLDLIRGAFLPTSVDNLKLGAQKPPMPFSDARLLGVLALVLVRSQRGLVSCHAQSTGEETEPFLPRLQRDRGGGERCRNRRCGFAAGAGSDGRSSQNKNHHSVMREVDYGRDCEAVDGHTHAAQLLHPRDLLSGSLQGAITLDGA
jgi:hypothetical protein